MRGTVSLMIVAGMTLTAGSATAALPGPLPRVRVTVPFVISRTARAPLVRFHPVLSTNAFRASSPSLGLPALPPVRLRALPVLQPLEAAALTTVGFDACGRARPGVLIAMLPVAPFAPLSCPRRAGGVDEADRQTSLVPGRNKDALYGRAYSPHDLDAP